MIARAPSRPRPIPFLDPLQQAAVGVSAALLTLPPCDLDAHRVAGIHPSFGRASDAARPALGVTPLGGTTGVAPLRHRARREVLVRHDGEQPVSVRSAATGHHYRFEACGGTQWVDASDIALLRRIEHMHIV